MSNPVDNLKIAYSRLMSKFEAENCMTTFEIADDEKSAFVDIFFAEKAGRVVVYDSNNYDWEVISDSGLYEHEHYAKIKNQKNLERVLEMVMLKVKN
jgi:hypothetical protein